MAVPRFDLWPSFSDTSIIPLTGFLFCPVPVFGYDPSLFTTSSSQSAILLVKVIYNWRFDAMFDIFLHDECWLYDSENKFKQYWGKMLFSISGMQTTWQWDRNFYVTKLLAKNSKDVSALLEIYGGGAVCAALLCSKSSPSWLSVIVNLTVVWKKLHVKLLKSIFNLQPGLLLHSPTTATSTCPWLMSFMWHFKPLSSEVQQ